MTGKRNWKINSIDDLDEVLLFLDALAADYRIFLFNGGLGAGKTTLIKKWMEKIGVVDHVTSPTYAIINEYMSVSGETIYHMDCYRLSSIEEALEVGIDEYLNSGNLCLIEWPELLTDLIEVPYVDIEITQEDSGERFLDIWFEC